MIRSIKMLVAILVLSSFAHAQFYPTGGYQGGGYGSGGDKTLDVIVVDLKAYLQGAYNGIDMNTDLNDQDLLPLTQPYDSVPFYWHYTGSESVDSIPNNDVVDWIEIEIRETTGDASTANESKVVGRRAGFLLRDGTITDIDGSSELRFKYIKAADNIFTVVEHRNHLAVMNALPLAEASEVHHHDFTTAQEQAYQDPAITGNAPMADLGGGKFGLWAGNAYPDDQVAYDGTNNDREEILARLGIMTPSKIVQAYHRTDLDLDSWIKYMGAGNDKVYLYNILGKDASNILQSHVP